MQGVNRKCACRACMEGVGRRIATHAHACCGEADLVIQALRSPHLLHSVA